MKSLHELENLIEEAASAKAASLVPAIERAIDAAIVTERDIEEIVSLCISKGYTESYVRSTISKLLVERDIRRIAQGGGRRVDPKAVTLLQHAIKAYGAKEAQRLLLAAYRLSVALGKSPK